ncbi:hypothetical protein [Curvivirga aplysinae]|uniref:hypothetical protein n=1 Tax=Curvivirga aplysinae TaxID=2529852 RepID=UPI0012BD5A33|nr:hypothetical protein [Curvivirga aplysinae]
MEICLFTMRKIKINRGDAIGGALPLSVMKASSMSEMKPSFNRRTRRRRGMHKNSFRYYLIMFLIFGLVAGLVAALLTEGPKL